MSSNNNTESLLLMNDRDSNDMEEESFYEELPAGKDKSPQAKAARRKIMLGAVVGEFVATFAFIFVVTAAHCNLTSAQSPNADLGGALAAGLMLCALAFSFSEISGCHVNPAVTFATWLAGKTSNRKSLLFVVAQLAGTVLAMLMIMASFPDPIPKIREFALRPSLSDTANVFWMEFMLSFIFVFVVFVVAFEIVDQSNSSSSNFKLKVDTLGREIGLTLYTAKFAPIAIGATCFSLALCGGTVSGGCFNPARAFGPALLSGTWDSQWVYWCADLLGAAAAAGARKAIKLYLSYGNRLMQEAAGVRREKNLIGNKESNHHNININ